MSASETTGARAYSALIRCLRDPEYRD
jgi:hypothetical protein